FNYFSDVNRQANGGVFGFNVFRHIIGLEKTFLNERASIGLRLPVVDVEGPPGLVDRQFADMSIITKFALVNEPERVLSAGLVITVPTGRGLVINPIDPSILRPRVGLEDVIQDVLLQPYIGFLRHLTDRMYYHTFSSIAIPTDARDVVWMMHSCGFGWYLYNNPDDTFVQAIIPTVELHENTPLTDRGRRTLPIGVNDQLNMTVGTTFLLPRSWLGVAVCVPLVAPRPYNVELMANYTLRF